MGAGIQMGVFSIAGDVRSVFPGLVQDFMYVKHLDMYFR